MGALGFAACARPAAKAGPQTTSAAPAAPPVPVLDTRTRGFRAGTWYSYTVHMTSTVAMGDNPKAVDFDVDSLVRMSDVRSTPESATLYIAFVSPTIVSRLPGSQPAFDKIRSEVEATGCFATLTGGRITEMYFARGMSVTTANLYREVAAALQVSRAVGDVDRYTAEEYDTTGKYVAEYTAEHDGRLLHRHKQRYFAILAAKTAQANAPGQVVPRVLASDEDIRLDGDDHPVSVHATDEIEIQGAQAPVTGKTVLSLEAAATQAGPAQPPNLDDLLSRMQRLGADEPYGGGEPVESLDRARINGVTYEQAVSGLEKIAKEQEGQQPSGVSGTAMDDDERAGREHVTAETQRLFTALAAIFREKPETIPRAVHAIKSKSPASGFLTEALSSSSSPAAQSALVDLMNAKTDDPLLHNRAAFALSRTPRPDPQSVNALRGMLAADPFSEQALLGLGTYGRRFRDAGDGEQAAAIGNLLIDRLAAAKSTSSRLTVLRAITNSGFLPALDKVIPFMSDSREEIRVAAVRAPQSMLDARVDPILADKLKSDASTDVKTSALSAAKVRGPSDVLVAAVEAEAIQAQDPHVRYRAVQLLVAWTPKRSDIRTTLQAASDGDSEGRIRELARTAL
jgi:hypothetical protein